MTTRHYSRLLVGTAVLVLIVGLLFKGSTDTSAAKGDRSAPTAPTNLAAGTITETSVNLSWGASNDNSGTRREFSTTLGSAVSMPSTSVQI